MATAGGIYRLTSKASLTIKTVAPLVPRVRSSPRLTRGAQHYTFLSNALAVHKHLWHRCRQALEVRIQVTAADGMFAVTVADTGPGIAEAERQKIFEEFQRAESVTTRTQGGTGLGLAIAKKIVELHGGQIGAESYLGQGSTFWFTVPMCVEQQWEGV